MTFPLDRPLDRAEAFFWFLDRCSPMNFAVMAEGAGALEPARLEVALDRAQSIHPALSVAIGAGPRGGLAFVPQPGARAGFSSEAGGDDWRAMLAARLARRFELGEAPLIRAHWFQRPQGRWAFAVVFHHAIGDGRSGFRLVRGLIDEARGVETPGTPFEPRASLMALFPETLAGAAGFARSQEWKASLRREPLRAETPPGFRRGAGPARPGIVALHLEEPVLQALSNRARREGASVHGLLGAAELIAARDRFVPGVAPALMLTSPVDLRGQLSVPVDDATPGFHVTLLSSICRVSGPAQLWPLARFLSGDLRRQLAEGCGHLFYHLVPPAETLPATAEAIAGFSAYLQRMPTAFLLSNVGRVEAMPEARGVCVDEMSFALCPMAHQPLFAAASTWGGRLTLNLVHDANRLSPGDARDFATRMEALLRAAAS